MRAIDFYFDFISPNAYLAWERLPSLAERHGATIAPRPVLFAALLDSSGRIGPAERPASRRWMVLNVLRKTEALGIPFAPPPSHPFNPLLALRVVGCIEDPAPRDRAIAALFRATWAEGRGVETPEAVESALTDAGLDGAALVAAATGADAKSRLREATDAAIAAGVFGVPTMIVDGELFWGYDDFPQLDRHLGGESSISAASLAAWRDVKPSARRPGGS